VVRRAINVIKDRIAAMDWQVRCGVECGGRRGLCREKAAALRRTLEEPNAVDSFRTLIEQAIEDALTGGMGHRDGATATRNGRDAVGGGWGFDPH